MKRLIIAILNRLGLLDLVKSFGNKFNKPVNIPAEGEKRSIILSYKKRYNPEIFVETGTLFGDTVQALSPFFKMSYSIELSNELATRARKRFEGVENIRIIEGDSGDKLGTVVDQISAPALFWLDGHYSGEFYHSDELIKTAKGIKDSPVKKELQIIIKSDQPHVILIDDARLFGKGDYPTMAVIKKEISKSKYKYELSVEKDIIRIVPTHFG